MGTHNAAGMQAFVDSVITRESPRGRHEQTDVQRVRDGLQTAIAGLSLSERDCCMQRVLTAFHWLLGPLTQEEITANADDMLRNAEWLANYYGPADAEPNCDASFECRRDA